MRGFVLQILDSNKTVMHKEIYTTHDRKMKDYITERGRCLLNYPKSISNNKTKPVSFSIKEI